MVSHSVFSIVQQRNGACGCLGINIPGRICKYQNNSALDIKNHGFQLPSRCTIPCLP